MWNGVHVQDLVDLYLILMDDALSCYPLALSASEGYYFCATNTYQWKHLAAEVGSRLHALGAIAHPAPRQVSAEEEGDVFGAWSGFAYASNCETCARKVGTTTDLGL